MLPTEYKGRRGGYRKLTAPLPPATHNERPLFCIFIELINSNGNMTERKSNSVCNHTSDKRNWTITKRESDLSITDRIGG